MIKEIDGMRKIYDIPEYEIEKFNTLPVITSLSDPNSFDNGDNYNKGEGEGDGFDF